MSLEGVNTAENAEGDQIDALLSRIRNLTNDPQGNASATPSAQALAQAVTDSPSNNPKAPSILPGQTTAGGEIKPFIPVAPKSYYEAGVSDAFVEELICKFLLARGEASGRDIAEQIRLPFVMIEPTLARLKSEQLIAYVGQATLNDYIIKLTEAGCDRGQRFTKTCSYFGATPVRIEDYYNSVRLQSLENQHPGQEDLQQAFSDLLIDPTMMGKLGPAVNSGKGMFLYGYPGNGKTSIAERVTAAFGKYIWIPRSLLVDNDVVRLFDPMNHFEAPLDANKGLLTENDIDHRWVRIERPTIVVGGELTMEHLEINYNHVTGISEAPIQLKSNCGTLVIDDFGRQRMSVDELLNRWIVPLEKRYDFLNTSNGKKIQVPFDQLVIFSTNLEPKDLVDDAFLRRIPYKIEVENPSRENFTKLFGIMCKVMGFEYRQEAIDRLIEKHYLPINRPFRNCHPRDLLLQIKNYALYHKKQKDLSDEAFDFACENYFSVM